jgi:hypothetical protein
VYKNEEGEVLGWDYPSRDEPEERDPYDDGGQWDDDLYNDLEDAE